MTASSVDVQVSIHFTRGIMVKLNDSNGLNYFKIGTFVLVGIGLMIFALLIFGSSKLFQKVIYIETYFEESIQGVSEGTPVKYRGLQIGYVKSISFASEIYKLAGDLDKDERTRAIYVKIAITSKLFTELSSEEVAQFLTKEVAEGLRVKLVAKGLTGTSYLELDYVDPKTSPLPKLDWEPKVFFIPTVTSTLTLLSENAQNIMNELKDVDFKRLFSSMITLTASLNRVTNRAEILLNQINNPLLNIVQNFKIVSDDLRVVSNRIKLKPSDIVFSSYPPPLDPNKL